MPIFHDGRDHRWVAATIHEGENGACEPGGMPSGSRDAVRRGLQDGPFKVVENVASCGATCVTFLQNSVRDPKLQLEDMKVKLARRACGSRSASTRDHRRGRVSRRLVAALRVTLEDIEEEVRRRIERAAGRHRAASTSSSTRPCGRTS